MEIVASIQKFSLPLFIPLLLVSCSTSTPENTDGFPQKIDITPQSTTDFIANLEHALPEGKNVIYTPSFLFAWDNLRNQLPEIKLTSASTNDDISQVQSTTTFKNAMSKKDYEKDVQIQDDTISISSKQHIELTFDPDLQ